MEARESRRDRTWRRARRAQRAHLRGAHPDGVIDCVCERSVWYFAKRHALGCGCRRRRAGRPKVGRGACFAHDLRAPVRDRIDARRLCARWTAWVRAHAPDDFTG